MSKLLDGKLPVVRLRRLEDGSPKKKARSKQAPSKALAKMKAALLEAARQLCTDNIEDSIKLADDIRLQSTKIRDERIIDARFGELENVDKLERNLQRYYDTLIEGVQTLKSALAEELADWRTHFRRTLGGTLAAGNSKTGGRRGVKPTSDEENMSVAVDEASSTKMDQDNDSDKENMSKDKVNVTRSDSDEGITSRDEVDSDRQSSVEQVTSKKRVKGRKRVSSERGTPSKDNNSSDDSEEDKVDSERDEKQSSDEENLKKRVKGRKRVSSERGTPSKDNSSDSSDEGAPSKDKVKDGGKLSGCGSTGSENSASDVDLAMECVGESDASAEEKVDKQSESDDNYKAKSKSSQKEAKANNEKCSKMKLKCGEKSKEGNSNEKSTLKKRKSEDSNSEDSNSDDGKSEKLKNDDDEVDTSLKKELDVSAKRLLESSSDDLLDEDEDADDDDDDDDDVQVAKKTSSKEKKLTKKRASPRKVGQDEDDKPKVAKSKKCKEEEDDEKESKEIARLTNLKSLEATGQQNSDSSDSNSGSRSEDVKPKANKTKTPAVKKRKASNSEASKENSSDSKDINYSDDDDSDDIMDYIIPKIIKQEDIHHKVLQCLFESSASQSSEIGEEEDLGKKKKGKKAKNEKKKRKIDESSDTDASRSSANVFQIKQKSWRKDKLLSGKLTDTDTSEDERRESKWRKKQQQKAAESSDSSDVDFVAKKDKAKKPRIVLSDSDIIEISESDEDSSSSVEITKKGKKRKRGSGSSANGSSSSDDTKKKAKKKRKRIINNSSSDEDEGGEAEGDQLNESNASQGKSGRKNIKKIMKDRDVAEATKSAAKEEEERRQRIMERQKMYNAIYEAVEDSASKKVEKLVLDFDPETKKTIISVDKGLVDKMKPHQAKGVKFMWDACFESVERIKTSKGGGCILAHCMGLGKTFQVVSLVHTLLTHKKLTRVKRVLIVCPFSTILNWCAEFDKWMKEVHSNDDLNVSHIINEKENYRRAYRLKDWHEEGGVMIMGYDMFRNLTNQNKKLKAKLRDAFQTTLVDPGADLVVCDEGHLLKNEATALSKAMTRIKTLRRVVLTGTPLQNNLVEYHCMVSFIKPKLLGSKKEFTNRFVNPINNGQFADSTERDFRIMKRRAHVLHKMLDGLVQRCDYNVLTPYLPPKQEYVLSIRLTDLQVKLYQRFLDNKGSIQKGMKVRLLADFQMLSRVWTHPLALKYNLERQLKKAENEERSSDSAGSLKDFVADSSSEDAASTSQSDDEAESKPSAKRVTRANKNSDDDLVEVEDDPEKKAAATRDAWWSDLVESHHFDDIAVSSKLILLFDLLKKCDEIGDKVLVFSQSLYSLDLIEHFLSEMDDATQRGEGVEGGEGDPLLGHRGSWSRGLDYFRLDGSTKGENRSAWIKSFNRESNTRARLFLISTKAGGLGINLTAANRVIIFDASWNPSHDIQSIFRIYRFGQRKPCYIYRFVAQGTMEEKVYERQISKLSLSQRVVDEQQVNRYFSQHDLQELYNFKPAREEDAPIPIVPKDRLMADMLQEHKKWIFKMFEHDSLLDHVEEEELDEEERKAAWDDYENEKKRAFGGPQPSHHIPSAALNFNIVKSSLPPETYDNMMKMIEVKYPHKTAAEKHSMAETTMTQVYIKCYNEKLQQQYQREALQRQREHTEYLQRVQQQMRMGSNAAPSRPWTNPRPPSSSANK